VQKKSNSGPTSDIEPRSCAIRHRDGLRAAILAVVGVLLLIGSDEAAEGRIVRRPVVVTENTAVSPTDALKGAPAAVTRPDDETLNLFDPSTFPKGWVHFSAEKGVTLGSTWKVEPGAAEKEPVLVCLGRPFGYIRTERLFQNCELTFEWKYPSDANANSGVLVFTNGPDKIWPQAVQVQLHRPTAGIILPGGGVAAEKVANASAIDLPLNEWHKCVVTCRGGRVVVAVNGKKISEATGCDPEQGSIAIQSEGSEVHFRRIRIRAFK
jgi:hypothetical protein